MNIVSIAMSLLTPAVVGRIATALGINPAMAQMAVNAALPAILAAIAHKAAHPAGLGALSGVLAQQTPGLLGNLGEVIGGAKQAQLLASGQKSLSVLFGGPPVGVLAGAVAKFAGVPEMASAGLLGLLAPVALGTIAQQQQAGGLDAAGLAQMLAGQKDALAAALPAGFGQFLVASGVLGAAEAPAAQPAKVTAAAAAATPAPVAETDDAEALANVAAEAVRMSLAKAAASATPAIAATPPVSLAEPVPVKPSAVSEPAVTATAQASSAHAAAKVMESVPAAVVVVPAGVVEAAAKVVESPPAAVEAAVAAPLTAKMPMAEPPPVMPKAPELAPRMAPMVAEARQMETAGGGAWRWLLAAAAALVLGFAGWQFLGRAPPDGAVIVYNNVDVGAKSNALYERLKTTVSSVKDDASATAALPKLREAVAELGDIRDIAGKLPVAPQKSLRGLFVNYLLGMRGLIGNAIRSAGADSATKPLLEQVLRRMSAIAEG